MEIQLAISDLSHGGGRVDKYDKTNICTFLEIFHCKRTRHEHRRGMYLIGQMLSGNMIIFWIIVINIIGSYYDKYLK